MLIGNKELSHAQEDAGGQRTAAAHPSEGALVARLPELDGLRGVAITLVVVMHFGVPAFAAQADRWLGGLILRLLYVGWAGVDLFFVLSGFLITSILLASLTEPQYFRTFYARRTLRIFPLYFVTLS